MGQERAPTPPCPGVRRGTASGIRFSMYLTEGPVSVARCEYTEAGPCSHNCSPSFMAQILGPFPWPGLYGVHPSSPLQPLGTLQRVAAVSHHLCGPSQGRLLQEQAAGWPAPTLEEAGWPWPCSTSTGILHLLNQSPGMFPRAPTALAIRLESWSCKTACL